LAGFEKAKQELEGLGIKVYAASADDEDKAAEIAADLSFPVAHGVTPADADAIGAWWGAQRDNIQPAEFVIDAEGKVASSTYSSGPIGRLDAEDVVALITFRDKRAQQSK
jgi:peroxiredoxin